MNIDNSFWQNFLNDLIPVLVPIVGVLLSSLVAVAVQYFRLLEAKIAKEKPKAYDILVSICIDAVKIAEQMQLAKLIDDKKKWAVEYVQKKSEEAGLKIDVATIEEQIEKAVYEELTFFKTVE